MSDGNNSPEEIALDRAFKRASGLRYAKYALTGSSILMLGPTLQETLFNGQNSEKYMLSTGIAIGALAVTSYFYKLTESSSAELMIEIAREDDNEDPKEL